MFCQNCGASNHDGAKFCTTCGKPMGAAPAAPVPPQAPQPTPQPAPAPQPQPKPAQDLPSWASSGPSAPSGGASTPPYGSPSPSSTPPYGSTTPPYGSASAVSAPPKKGKGPIVAIVAVLVVLAGLVAAFALWFYPTFLGATPYEKAMETADEAAADQDWAEAIDAYTDAINEAETDEEELDALRARAAAYDSMGQYENAISDYQKALRLDPSQTDLQLLMLEGYLALEDHGEVIDLCEDLLDEDDSQVDLWGHLADAYLAQGNAPAALSALEDGFAATSSAELESRAEDLRATMGPEEVVIAGFTFARDETSVSLPELDLTDEDVADLRWLTQLEELELGFNNITDISFVAGMQHLEYLDLEGNPIADLSPLADLPSLAYLYLESTGISDADLVHLAGLDLKNLYLNNNGLTDLSPLSGMTNMTHLIIDENSVSDISFVEDMDALIRFDATDNQISDISPLAGKTALVSLTLWNNPVSNISPLAGLTSLTYLDLDNTLVSDVTPLLGLTNLETLYVSGDNVPANVWSIIGDALPQFASDEPDPPTSTAAWNDGYLDVGVITEGSYLSTEDDEGYLEGYAVDVGLELCDRLVLEPYFIGDPDADYLLSLLGDGTLDILILDLDQFSPGQDFDPFRSVGPLVEISGDACYVILRADYVDDLGALLDDALRAMDDEGYLYDLLSYWAEFDYSVW